MGVIYFPSLSLSHTHTHTDSITHELHTYKIQNLIGKRIKVLESQGLPKIKQPENSGSQIAAFQWPFLLQLPGNLWSTVVLPWRKRPCLIHLGTQLLAQNWTNKRVTSLTLYFRKINLARMSGMKRTGKDWWHDKQFWCYYYHPERELMRSWMRGQHGEKKRGDGGGKGLGRMHSWTWWPWEAVSSASLLINIHSCRKYFWSITCVPQSSLVAGDPTVN